MKTPRTLKSAMENGYVISKLYAKYSKKLRVTVRESFMFQIERCSLASGWIENISREITLTNMRSCNDE